MIGTSVLPSNSKLKNDADHKNNKLTCDLLKIGSFPNMLKILGGHGHFFVRCVQASGRKKLAGEWKRTAIVHHLPFGAVSGSNRSCVHLFSTDERERSSEKQQGIPD